MFSIGLGTIEHIGLGSILRIGLGSILIFGPRQYFDQLGFGLGSILTNWAGPDLI